MKIRTQEIFAESEKDRKSTVRLADSNELLFRTVDGTLFQKSMCLFKTNKQRKTSAKYETLKIIFVIQIHYSDKIDDSLAMCERPEIFAVQQKFNINTKGQLHETRFTLTVR